MEAVGRDFIDNSVRTPFEQLIRDMESHKKEITYKIKSESFHIHLVKPNKNHPIFHMVEYIEIYVEEVVGDEFLRFVLAAAKQAFPNTVIFISSNGSIIGTGPHGQMFVSEGFKSAKIYKSLKDLQYALYKTDEELEYVTIHKYYISTPIQSVNKMSYARGLNYFDKIWLEAYVGDTNDFLFTSKSLWKIVIDGETGVSPMYYTKIEQVQELLMESNNRNIKVMYLHKKFHTKPSFISFLCEDYVFEETEEQPSIIPYDCLFSLYCQYGVYRCHDLLEHRNLYRNFVEIIKESIKMKHIYACGSLPMTSFPKIYNILCALNHIFEIESDTFERDSDELLEIGFEFEKPKEEELQMILIKDTRYFLTINEQNNPTAQQFIEWYKIMRNHYNKTHPSPFLQRIIYPDDVLNQYYDACKGKNMGTIPKHFIDVEREIKQLIIVLENISPERYFFDYLQTLLLTTPLLLTRSNTLFNPSPLRCSFFKDESIECVNKISGEFDKNLFNSNLLLLAFNNKTSKGGASLEQALSYFNTFEKHYYAFIEIENRLPQFDIASIVSKLLKKTSKLNLFHHEVEISLVEGLNLFTYLQWTPEKIPNELEWRIKRRDDIRNETAYYVLSPDEVRFSLSWFE